MKVIATINSALYSGLVKILGTLSQGKDSSDIISIDNGVLTDATVNGFLRADLSDLFDKNSIDIMNPAYTSKLMKLLKGGDKFHFLNDEENNKYHITNNIASISTLKAASKRVISIPEIGELKSSVELDSDVVNTIADAQKMLEAEYVTLHIVDDKLVALDINNDYEYKFDSSADLSKAEKYKMYDFMPLKAQEYKLEIYKTGDSVWIKTIMDLSLIEAEYFEKLTAIGEFDGFTLV